MTSLSEQLKRCVEARDRAMKNVQRFTAAYVDRQDGNSYLNLVEALAWAEAIRMECSAVSQLAAEREVPFEVTDEAKSEFQNAKVSA